ncbi:hypothetical protein D9M71_614040 [compost metagenome]
MENHPAGRAVPGGHRDPAGGSFAVPHGAQLRAGESLEHGDADRGGPGPDRVPGRKPGAGDTPAVHGRLSVRPRFLPAGAVFARAGRKALPRCLRPARRPDPPGQVGPASQPGPARPVPGVRTQWAGRQGRTVRRSGRAWQQRQGSFRPLLVAADAGQGNVHGAAGKGHGRHQHRPQRRSGQRLVHLPAHHAQAVRDRTLLL